MNRSDNFSVRGRIALFDYLEDLEDQTGEELELDVIEICCTFTEYANLAEFQNDYGEEFQAMEDIEDHTSVIPVHGDSFIIQAF